MLKYLLIISFVISTYSVFSQKRIIEPISKINIKSLQLSYHKPVDKLLLTFKPLHKVKFTFKAGLNSNLVSKVNTDTLVKGDIADAFHDFDSQDFIAIGRYDVRCKIYLSRDWRLLFRTVTVFNKNIDYYMVGLICKF